MSRQYDPGTSDIFASSFRFLIGYLCPVRFESVVAGNNNFLI